MRYPKQPNNDKRSRYLRHGGDYGRRARAVLPVAVPVSFVSHLRREWQRLKTSRPGRRFTERFGRKHTAGTKRPLYRLVYISGGVLISAVGLVIRLIPFLPGGSALITLGAAMVSRESRTTAAWLDRCEVAMRQLWTRAYSRTMQALRRRG